jgi:hypothetical protein
VLYDSLSCGGFLLVRSSKVYQLEKRMKPPLKIIRAWIDGLPEAVSNQLKFFCAGKLLDHDKLALADEPGARFRAGAEFRDWLSVKLWYTEHVGRTLAVCAVIDYIMMDQGSEHWWEYNLFLQLTMVDSGHQPRDLRSHINAGLPTHSVFKEEWLGAADSWARLRETELSYVALQQWEATHVLRKF